MIVYFYPLPKLEISQVLVGNISNGFCEISVSRESSWPMTGLSMKTLSETFLRSRANLDQRDRVKNPQMILRMHHYPIVPNTKRIDLKKVEDFLKVVYLHDVILLTSVARLLFSKWSW